MRLVVLYFLFLVVSGTGAAQILNIEQRREDLAYDSLVKQGKKMWWLGKATFGFQMFNRSASANEPVDLLGLNGTLNTALYRKKQAWMLLGQLDFLQINDDPWLNFGFLHGRWHGWRKNRFSPEAFVQYSYDNFRGLDPRWLLGGNLRWHIIQEKKFSAGSRADSSDRTSAKFRLDAGLGVFYEWERWQHPMTNTLQEVRFLKGNSYLHVRWTPKEWMDLNLTGYYQSGYDASIRDLRHRIHGVAFMNLRLLKWLSLTQQFECSYEDKPIVPITKWVFSWRMGLSLDF